MIIIIYDYYKYNYYNNCLPNLTIIWLSGLTMELFIQADDYLDAYTTGVGFRMGIAPFGTIPLVYNDGYAIPPGREVYLAMTYVSKILI